MIKEINKLIKTIYTELFIKFVFLSKADEYVTIQPIPKHKVKNASPKASAIELN